MAVNAYKFLKKRPHNIIINLSYGFDSSREYLDKTVEIFMEKFKKLQISDYQIITKRVFPTVACHSGPEVFGIAVYGENKPIQ